MFIAYELDLLSYKEGVDFTLDDCLFGAVKLIPYSKNAHLVAIS